MKDNVKQQIIAIGGGSFSRFGIFSEANSLMERYFLQQTGKKKPSICFIPTASGENPNYIIDFYRFFGYLDCKPSHLSLFEPPTSDLESFILEKDAIYIGGGNTKSMLALWKEWKLDQFLKKAWKSGIVLGGVSAGSICWFEEGVTDSIPGDLTALKCLGFLKGSSCPHYNGEKKRRPSFQKLIKNDEIGNGIAIDDFTALHYINKRLEKVVRSMHKGSAYKVFKKNNEIIEERIESVYIGDL